VVVPEFQAALILAFPETTWGAIVRGLREGIALADDVVKNTPMLNTPVGRDLRGHLRRVGVLYRFQHLCRVGDLPFKAQVSEMPIGIWHWLDIRSGQFLAHVVRTECTGALPGESANRQAQCVKNQYDLLTDGRVPPISEIIAKIREFYSFLTFGTDEKGIVTHACMGMPSSDNTEWLAYANLLRQRDAGREAPSAAPKSPKPKDRMRFLDHIQEALAKKRKGGDESA
jgi:hypothetical protein